jgi:hypothetical protein
MRTYTVLLNSGEKISVQGLFAVREESYIVIRAEEDREYIAVAMFPEANVRAIFEGELAAPEPPASSTNLPAIQAIE